MPVATGKGHCALGVDGARHLETASQAVHAGGCLPGENMQAEPWTLLGRAPGMAQYPHSPSSLGTTESLCTGCQSHPVGHFGGGGLQEQRAEGQEAQPRLAETVS